MKAQFVNENLNEKFKDEDTDPIKDMGIGYPAKQLNTKAWKILKFIESKGEEGASFTEIQHFIYVDLCGGSEDSFWKKEKTWGYNPGTRHEYETTGRASRGMYCTNLYGHSSYWGAGQPGLLHKYCKKNAKGKWVLVRLPKPYEAIYK